MKFVFYRPEVYLDKVIYEVVNLGSFAKGRGIDSAKLWKDHYGLFKKIEKKKDWPAEVISSLQVDDYFRLDKSGNVINEEGKKTGFRVNGLPGKSIGSWDDIFVPIDWLDEVMKHGFGTDAKDVTWEQIHPKNKGGIE